MNYVQSHVRPSNYLTLVSNKRLPANMNAEKCLELEAGICGSHVETFHKVMENCDITVKRRSVEFYLHDEVNEKNSNHIAVEVFYGGRWRFFDVTSGTVFLRPGAKKQDDLLSAIEIRELAKASETWRDLMVTNAANDWCRRYAHAKQDIN